MLNAWMDGMDGGKWNEKNDTEIKQTTEIFRMVDLTKFRSVKY
jgi:hypothetical protein